MSVARRFVLALASVHSDLGFCRKSEFCFFALVSYGSVRLLTVAGIVPRGLSKTRRYADPGSSLYIDYLQKVPVAPAEELSMISVGNKEKTFGTYTEDAVYAAEAKEDGSGADDGENAAPEEHREDRNDFATGL